VLYRQTDVDLGKRAENAQMLLNQLYKRPAITVSETAKLLELSHTAATNLIKQFQELGILIELTGYQRNRVYLFDRYIALFSL